MRVLKLFEAFDKLIIEARVGVKRYDSFIRQYGRRTGNRCDDILITRVDDNAWDNSLDTKIYFNAPQWVIESLEKLGIHVSQGIVVSLKKTYTGINYDGISHCQYTISNNELFWDLVDYGYRLGENNAYPYAQYEMEQALKMMERRAKAIVPGMEIRQIEAENPMYEAQLLASMAA